MSTLALPSRARPSNLSLPYNAWGYDIEGDVYNICERIKEVSPDLRVVMLDRDPQHTYAIVELCGDGVERLVYKLTELDGRVIHKLRYLMSVPLDERMKIIERENYQFEQAEREREMDELYETLGRPMWTQLEHDGFIQRGVSYPKSGHVGGKGNRKRS